MSFVTYTLYCIEDDGTTTSISTQDTALEDITDGARVTESVNFDYAYELRTGAATVASFRPNRTAYRGWAIRSGRMEGDYIHALDDRYDHDVDELAL
jgi:hypothetical protein